MDRRDINANSYDDGFLWCNGCSVTLAATGAVNLFPMLHPQACTDRSITAVVIGNLPFINKTTIRVASLATLLITWKGCFGLLGANISTGSQLRWHKMTGAKDSWGFLLSLNRVSVYACYDSRVDENFKLRELFWRH